MWGGRCMVGVMQFLMQFSLSLSLSLSHTHTHSLTHTLSRSLSLRCGEQTVQMLQQRWHAIVTRELGFKNLEEMQVRVSV